MGMKKLPENYLMSKIYRNVLETLQDYDLSSSKYSISVINSYFYNGKLLHYSFAKSVDAALRVLSKIPVLI